jgi:hypothetical protein
MKSTFQGVWPRSNPCVSEISPTSTQISRNSHFTAFL